VAESNPSPRIFLSAGEASGDYYGAQILAELRTRLPQLTCFGLGGTEMAAAGLDRIVRAEDVAHMGITEVIRHMPRIYGEYRRLVSSIKSRRPDIAILIDFPDVNFRLARELRKLNIPVIYFVSPQLWAWKRKRLRWVQQRVDRMMVIFPFEERFYRARNVDATFVGHPLAQLPLPDITRTEYAEKHTLDPSKKWIALLPGSRRKEVQLNLPEMLHAASLLNTQGRYEFIIPVASTVNNSYILNFLQDPIYYSTVKPRVIVVDDAREALHHARASIVASGTATVQATVIGNPFIVVYRVSPFTFALARQLIRYPVEIPAEKDWEGNLPIAMVNLVAGKRIVPELLQTRFTAENVVATLTPLLADSPQREQMLSDLAEAHFKLLPTSGAGSIPQVCDAVATLLGEARTPSGRISATSV
jgi:lipid-A-disaccharide synthase